MNKYALGLVATLLPMGAAHAAVISDTDSYGPAKTEITSTNASNPLGNVVNADPLSLMKFDSALGTLNSVTVTLMGEFESFGTVVNSAATTVTANASESVGIFFESDVFDDTGISASDSTGFVSFAPGMGGTAVDLAGSDMAVINPAVLAPFIGAAGDTFAVDFWTIVETSFQGGGGNLDFMVETDAMLKVTVEYDYTEAPVVPAVPLPASLPLMLAGLAGVGLVARRRR